MISQLEYLARREQLAQQLTAGSIAFIPAASESIRSADTHYRFRQDSNFFYLTGFNEPNAILVLIKGKETQHILFSQAHNPEEEQWTGKRLGQEGALNQLNMSAAFPISQFTNELPGLLAGKSSIYYSFGRRMSLERQITRALAKVKAQVRRGIQAPSALCDIEPIISEMRLIKSDAEIQMMRQAATISVKAHKRVMQICKQMEFEYQLESELVYEFTRNGCRSIAYEPIVGSGEDACILHYTENSKPLRKGDLVLIDAGGEYYNYAADITRTFPINGQFSPEQRAIYDLVLKSQKAAIGIIKPGLTWDKIQKTIVRILTEGLCELGILKGKLDELIDAEAYKPFYMHNSGHWLGLDVHDVGQYKINGEWRPLEAGMVLTVEPGIYISYGMDEVEKKWWGIGIRIEDDILVTKSGYDVLTGDLPVDPEKIEAFMRG